MPASAWLMPHPSTHPLILRTGKQAARPERQHHEEGKMARQDLPLRIDAGTDGLGEPEHDATSERPPEAAETADDHGLESIEQPAGTDGRSEIRPQYEI